MEKKIISILYLLRMYLLNELIGKIAQYGFYFVTWSITNQHSL